jgi:glycosyltransferase involved in cell wall biosynthesis
MIADTRPTLSRCRHAIVNALRSGRPKRLRVGVDVRPFYESLTGVGWYLHHLLEQLAQRDDVELVLFGETVTTDRGPFLHAKLPSGLALVTIDLRGIPHTRFSRPLALASWSIVVLAWRCHLIFGANYFLPRSLSALAQRRVVTVHDLTFRRFPELLQAETLANLRREIARELFRADAVICVSEATRRDLLEFFSIEPRRAVTVRSGLAPMAAAPSRDTSLPPRYLLFVSTIEPRKNLDVLLTAFESLRANGHYEGDLVIVGKVGWKSEGVARRMRNSRWSAAIHHLDYIGRERLASIYTGAEVFVFPSLYEGFGFPLLEAMSHGVPVIAARNSSLPEIGGDAALYFEATDARELEMLIRRVTSDRELHSRLVEAGRNRAGEFQWSRAAEETLDVFRRAAERS